VTTAAAEKRIGALEGVLANLLLVFFEIFVFQIF
jgi:hypothetical protein